MATPDMDLSRAAWRKSSYSNNGGACVEVATTSPDSWPYATRRIPSGPSLVFSADGWQAFIRAMKD